MHKNNKAFTLIELLVVVLIIGILSAVALPQYQKTVEKARVGEAFIILKHLKNAQELYYIENGSYATTFDQLGMEAPQGKHFSYILGQISTTAKSLKRPYQIAFRYKHQPYSLAGDIAVCGFDVNAENGEELAKPWCKVLGANTAVK